MWKVRGGRTVHLLLGPCLLSWPLALQNLKKLLVGLSLTFVLLLAELKIKPVQF